MILNEFKKLRRVPNYNYCDFMSIYIGFNQGQLKNNLQTACYYKLLYGDFFMPSGGVDDKGDGVREYVENRKDRRRDQCQTLSEERARKCAYLGLSTPVDLSSAEKIINDSQQARV